MSPLDLLRPMLAAFAVSGAVLILASFIRVRETGFARRIAVWLAPAAGYVTGAWLVRGFPGLPPVDAAGWIIWAMMALCIIGLLVPQTGQQWATWISGIIVIGLLLFLVARPLIGRALEGATATAWLGGAGIAWLGTWASIMRARSSEPAWFSLALLLAATVGLSVVLMIGGVASYSQYALGLAGVIAAAGVASLPFVRIATPPAFPATAMIGAPWGGLLVAGMLYADVPMASAVFAVVAILVFFLPHLPRFNRFSKFSLRLAQIVWLAAWLAAAIGLAYHRTPRFDF